MVFTTETHTVSIVMETFVQEFWWIKDIIAKLCRACLPSPGLTGSAKAYYHHPHHKLRVLQRRALSKTCPVSTDSTIPTEHVNGRWGWKVVQTTSGGSEVHEEEQGSCIRHFAWVWTWLHRSTSCLQVHYGHFQPRSFADIVISFCITQMLDNHLAPSHSDLLSTDI